jgi:hypothetical protein
LKSIEKTDFRLVKVGEVVTNVKNNC